MIHNQGIDQEKLNSIFEEFELTVVKNPNKEPFTYSIPKKHNEKYLSEYNINIFDINRNKMIAETNTTIHKNIKNYKPKKVFRQPFYLEKDNIKYEFNLYKDKELGINYPEIENELNDREDDFESDDSTINEGKKSVDKDLKNVVKIIKKKKKKIVAHINNYQYVKKLEPSSN